MARITTVFFDLGDTLWHYPNMPPPEVIRGETMGRITRLLAAWGYDMSGERNMIGRDIRLAVAAETERAFHGDCVDPDYPGICRRIAAEHGMQLTREQAEQLWETWNLGGVFLGVTLFPGARETLEWLRSRGYRIGSITNRGYSGPKFWEQLEHLQIAEYFEHVAVSCEVGYMKPHPRIFHYALEQMGVAAEESVMVGDSLRADVEGGKTVGMTTVWVRPKPGEPMEPATDEPEPGPVAPDYVIDEIAELPGLPLFAEGPAK
jgi:HAD superfamily hydrolase (TIGR01662 family)